MTTNNDTFRIQFSPKQKEAYEHQAQFLLYGGAKGGGKSWFLCSWLLTQIIQFPGNKLFMFRKRAVDTNNTTLETWRKSIPPKFWKINEQKKKIYLPMWDGVIDYGGLDDQESVEKLNSAEYGGGVLDQAEEISKDVFGMCRGTLRHKANGVFPSYQIRLSANPAQCWLKQDFILSPKKGFTYVKALPSDNPYLPDSYIENLREAYEHRPNILRAYLEGSWDELAANDVCIQTDWVEKAMGAVRFGTPIKRIIVNDPASFGDDENVVMVMEQTEACAYVTHFDILPKQDTMATAGFLTAMRRKHNASDIFVDAIGLGEGIVSRLNELDEPVHAIKSSHKPTLKHKTKVYFNLRSQMFMEAGELFANGKVVLQEDPVLAGQLSQHRFKFSSNGALQVQSKDELKKIFQRSPDRADCLVMGLYGLTIADRLDKKQYEVAAGDRQGHGTPIIPQHMEENDYSGYNIRYNDQWGYSQ